MPRFVQLTLPTSEAVYLNAETVVNVHEVFRTEGWAAGAKTVLLYSDGLRVAVKEDLTTVLALLTSPTD